jgi:hypothetical protein
VLTWSRGLIGFVGKVFEVMTQVDLGLTNVSQFDLADSAISVNDANQKPGASQPTPLRRISSRYSINKIRVIPSIMTRVTKEGRHLLLHLPISRIQMEQKVQGAFPTTSSPFMRKRAMNVHMNN